MAFEWDKFKAAAMKILGKDGDVPDLAPAVEKALDAHEKAFTDFSKAQDGIEQAILGLENTNDGVKNALKQFSATISKSDLGLDSKSKDDAKKIAQARKILMDRLSTGLSAADKNAKTLDELDKHVIQLSKYKPGSP